ncbi:MAG TPA: M28 family peptidase [Bacteroidia bacterium]|nr:M28 family peptidase [Bacteroidia bacterium]
MLKSNFPAFIVITAILFTAFAPDSTPTVFAETITAKDLKTHLSILASDEYEGRETGEKGQKMAATYIADKFRSSGIPELPGGGYYQDVPLLKLEPGEGSVSAAGKTYSFGKDFYYLQGTEDGETKSSQLVFAGYGIQDSAYKDYEGLDVRGKTVMVLAGEPYKKSGISLLSGKKEPSIWATQRRRKTNEARSRDAAILLIVVPDFRQAMKESEHAIHSPTLELYEEIVVAAPKKTTTLIYISPEMANELLKAGGEKKTVQKFASKIAKTKKTVHSEISVDIMLSIRRKSEVIHTENVLGYISGSDLKDELIVITAHYDHLGKEGSVVYNGADDDGSGTVAVIELAEAFAKAKKDGHGPRRSLLFMAVTGEEKGLLGSRWYSEHPFFPLQNTVCNLNIDMIGRIDALHKDDSNYIYVIGSEKLSSELKKINEAANAKYTKLNLDYRYDVPNDPNMFYYRSDHYNFARKGIPVAFYFNGVHPDYHKETDEIEKISFPMMEVRTRLVFYAAWELANRNDRIALDQKKK